MAPPAVAAGVPTPPRSSSGHSRAGSGTPAAAASLEERLSALLSSSDEPFHVAPYLNLALGGHDEQQQQQQQRMAELALQLQLQTQACHEDISRIGAELQAILPRCAADVGRLRVGLDGLQQDASTLLSESGISTPAAVSGAEPEQQQQQQATSPSYLETLSTLHALQAHLTQTREILTAAVSWDACLERLAPLLAQHDLPGAVSALATLEQGERALRGMPQVEGTERRDVALEKARQQVSTLLHPQLQHALQNLPNRLGPLQQCVSLYQQLNQMDALTTEYVKIRPAPLHRTWFEYQPAVPGSNRDAGSALLAWLADWLDQVLQFLAEERKQCQQVFGPEAVPQVVLKVFAECFRPLLASFKSRLESISSSDPAAHNKPTGGGSSGGLESICALYESTLQFLSLAYELLAGAWLDWVEANPSLPSTTPGRKLYQDMRGAFKQIASPFQPYQQGWAELEALHLQQAYETDILADVRRAGSAVANSSSNSPASRLEALQGATETLQGLSSRIFPLAEGALARFELLNGGYGAAIALQTVDRILSEHAKELTQAIHSLNKAMSVNEKDLAESFDDQHVLCALQVLKLAGSFRRELRSFQAKTKERLSVLLERMTLHLAREKEVEESTTGTATSMSRSSFVLPDGLSVVEIDSYLTQTLFSASSEETEESLTVLQRLVATDLIISTLYPEATEAATRLTHSCHMFVFDVCSAVPRYHIKGVSSMSAWREEMGQEDSVSYGTLPQQYITHVGEHMLALVQALEPFASDSEALALANEAMDGVRNVAVQAWIDFVGTFGSANLDSVRLLMDGTNLRNHVVSSALVEDEELDDKELDEQEKASSAFCNAWLDVVGLAVTGRLLERIMRIPSLTPKGCEHVNADLNYLVNVFTALGVSGHPHPLLGHIAEMALLDGDALAQKVASRDRADDVDDALRSIEERIGAIRGLAANFRY